MTDAELIAYGNRLKKSLVDCVNLAIEEALHLRHGVTSSSRDVMCQYASGIEGDGSFRFTLLDFVDSGQNPTTKEDT